MAVTALAFFVLRHVTSLVVGTAGQPSSDATFMVLFKALAVETANGARAVPLCVIALWKRPGKTIDLMYNYFIQ